MRVATGHLTYCTNIHPGENWPSHFAALKNNFSSIKARVSAGGAMGIGLRLSNVASIELENPASLAGFKQWLADNDAYVFTMNGFPYGEFHDTAVKDQVHAPDWTTRLRVDYTLRMFRILADLLPKGMDGGISTSPLSYKHWYKTTGQLEQAKISATANILLVAEELIKTGLEKGVIMHLDIEPEPDGVLETGEEFINWYENVLLPQGTENIARKFNVSAGEAAELIKQHITLCYDVCHFAIGYEPHRQVIDELAARGLKVGKIQISAALNALLSEDTDLREDVKNAFARFDESTYLHQVVAKKINGKLIRYPDLPEALADIENPLVEQWRAHFHVPIFTEEYGPVQSTQGDILAVLAIQKEQPFTTHLEVETYTWGVLPDAKKLPINDSIVRELNWVKDQL
ncbi:metabolite traffic protein EboE [Mucilaginibacter sp. UR6-11]|uniref:metabolite traffic protein EboE n=1 Tax=Mucilaginibacter sp. UR6-11 TaxID=1435644 RepID=UPI001E53BD52|nr:metabolite traffic protein EboE [Mucilaginibacter sp. UR6-11]MCC8424845.1 metabolite traffic protein EboE [Mucilaginibacter sp. UR6-11]